MTFAIDLGKLRRVLAQGTPAASEREIWGILDCCDEPQTFRLDPAHPGVNVVPTVRLPSSECGEGRQARGSERCLGSFFPSLTQHTLPSPSHLGPNDRDVKLF
jgi:hypothetical protein